MKKIAQSPSRCQAAFLACLIRRYIFQPHFCLTRDHTTHCGEWPIYLDRWNLLRPAVNIIFFVCLVSRFVNFTNWQLDDKLKFGYLFLVFGVHKNATNEPPTINQWSMTDFTVTNLHKKAWNFDSFSKLICSEWPIKDT